MRARIRFLAFLGIAAVAAPLCAAPARAGAGGEDLAGAQAFLNLICGAAGIASCPQLPTVNQVIVETSALTTATPDDVRALLSIPPPAVAIDAGTLAGLSNPLAFLSPTTKPGQPVPTLPSNPAANAFFSATTDLSKKTLSLVFDYRQRTISTFAQDQEVGAIGLPLVVADAGTNLVRNVAATLLILGDPNTCATCIKPQVVGDFLGTGTPQIKTLDDLGMSLSLDFSPNAIFSLDLPLLITSDVAPAYSFAAGGHEFDVPNSLFDGIDPIASFLDASFVNDSNDPPAFHVDMAIAIDGSTVLSSPIPEPASLALLGGGLLAFALLRRRRAAPGRPAG
jgi:hypothetical protein